MRPWIAPVQSIASTMAGRRRPVALVSFGLVLAVTLSSCAFPGSSAQLDGDPCLLQQYQNNEGGIVGRAQGAVATLTGSVGTLNPSGPALSATQGVSQTLTALRIFAVDLDTRAAEVANGASVAGGAPFRATFAQALGLLDGGAVLLSEVYVALVRGDTRAAATIAVVARQQVGRGSVLLAQARDDLAHLRTYSPNC